MASQVLTKILNQDMDFSSESQESLVNMVKSLKSSLLQLNICLQDNNKQLNDLKSEFTKLKSSNDQLLMEHNSALNKIKKLSSNLDYYKQTSTTISPTRKKKCLSELPPVQNSNNSEDTHIDFDSQVIVNIPISNPFGVLSNCSNTNLPIKPFKVLSQDKSLNNVNNSTKTSNSLNNNDSQCYSPLVSTETVNIPDVEIDSSGLKLVKNPSRHLPPITLLEIKDWSSLHSNLLKITKDKFIAKSFGDELKLFFTSSDDYRKTSHYLINHNIKHVVFSLDKEPLLRVVIKRLPSDIPIDQIKDDIEQNPDITIHKISRLKRTTTSKFGSPLILVQLINTKENKSIYSITEILGLSVFIEEFKKGNHVVQCYNCLQFHHGSLSCHLESRCVKCGGAHKFADCPKPKGSKPFCYNCKGEHTASYRGCPNFPTAPFGNIISAKPSINLPRKDVINFPKLPTILSKSSRSSVPLREQSTQSYSSVLKSKPQTITTPLLMHANLLMKTMTENYQIMMASIQGILSHIHE